MDNNQTQNAVADLDVDKVLKLLEFYESTASTVKGRTWTITAWILTLNSALFAFCFQLYQKNAGIAGFLYIQGAICLVGAALCVFLYFLIQDQGKHLQHYWTQEEKIGAWNPKIRDLVLQSEDLDKVLNPKYESPFPRFCKRLRLLCGMFGVGFIGTFILMRFLTSHYACGS